MRIGFSSLMIQGGKTGIAQYVFELLRALQKVEAHEFVIFVLQKDLPFFSFLEGRMTLVAVSEKYRPAVRNIYWHQQHLPRLAVWHQLDVLHVPSYRRLIARGPCPLVGTIHDLAPFRVPGKYDWKRMFYGRVVVRWLARRQDRIIAVSQSTATDIETFFKISRRQIEVVHNGLDHERFRPGLQEPARDWVREQFGIDGPFFLYISRLEHPGKNHLRLISAFERFKQSSRSPWHLVFGGSDWHGAEVIHEAIRRSQQRECIKCLGFVGEHELPDLYRAAGAFVYPSLFEGFGLPPIEAMACGCPVISSTRGSLAEVLGDAALTVDPESVEDICSQLARVSADEATAEGLRTLGFAQSRQFDWARTAAETLQVYKQAANKLAPRQASARSMEFHPTVSRTFPSARARK